MDIPSTYPSLASHGIMAPQSLVHKFEAMGLIHRPKAGGPKPRPPTNKKAAAREARAARLANLPVYAPGAMTRVPSQDDFPAV